MVCKRFVGECFSGTRIRFLENMKSEKIIYEVLDVVENKSFEGDVETIAARLKLNDKKLVYMYDQRKCMIKKRWKIVGKRKITIRKKVDYGYLTERNIKNLDIDKVIALHKAYTEGRSFYWTIENIADECGVPEETIKEVLKSRNII